MVCAVGFKSRISENSWNGASRRSLESEIANKRFMLHNIQDLDVWCKKAGVSTLLSTYIEWLLGITQERGYSITKSCCFSWLQVQLSIDVCVGQNPKSIVVEEAQNSGAYHVVVDK